MKKEDIFVAVKTCKKFHGDRSMFCVTHFYQTLKSQAAFNNKVQNSCALKKGMMTRILLKGKQLFNQYSSSYHFNHQDQSERTVLC